MTGGLELAAVFLLATGVVWAVDVMRRPYKRHRPCKGTGKVRVKGNRYDLCRGCDGGKKPQGLRVGARWLRPDLARRK